ncbi:hypothetical protein BKM31_55435 [[Actinomadura] parvosata subsp. kistnae]|uniref:Uncharacterized protein n=1 Tax=[Actinomadura] parvosata subsp. kistnae TaxID=1909395 RepID=A0A1V0AGW9_9ACTN|nr:hypothetical protein [Nonomuraea sp. ATCC 55076]AQZ69458.1 hypothetical protein BKM31_55435 [Nonomuraea sp. ATCC 55076]
MLLPVHPNAAARAAAIVLTLISFTLSCTIQDVSTPLPGRPQALPEVPEYESAASIWRDAVVTVPAKIKGKLPVEPAAMLGEDEVLMVTSSEWRPTFYSYDLRAGGVRALGTAPKWAECSLCFEIMSVATSETKIVWTAGVYRSEPWNAGKRHVELWTMPRSGGEMRLATWLTGHGQVPFEDRLSIVGDDAVWHGDGQAYRVPLEGGAAQRLPSLEQTVPAAVREWDGTQCGREWCVGLPPQRRYELTKLVVLRKDGTERREVVASYGGPLMNDRFGLFGGPYVNDNKERSHTAKHPGPQPILYDRCTEKSGRIGGLLKDSAAYDVFTGGERAASPEEPLLYWNSPDRKSWIVLDLSRIPDSLCT